MLTKPVLHSCWTWLSQTQTWLYSQLAELQRQGISAHVVCEQTRNLDQFHVDNIHSLRNECFMRQVWYRGLRKFRLSDPQRYLQAVATRIGAPTIHSHFGDMGWRNLTAVRSLGAKHVVTFYGYDVNQLPSDAVWRRRYDQMFEEADLFLCEGQHMSQCIVRLGAPEAKVKVQHLGIDVNGFRYEPRQWLPHEPLRVLIAASFREKKGIPFAVEALGVLHKEVPIALTIIGDAGNDDLPSQREKVKILQSIKQAGLEKVSRLLGYQPHSLMLQEAYKHHIFLQPSITAANGDTEGGAPVTIIEMLATGMIVVSTWHCDIPEVMGKDLHHLLAPERDTASLVRVLRSLVSQPEMWARASAAARDHIVAEYDLKKQVARLTDHYAID
jgi:colanic acid/amylovoran biosynthesis glycosyltransferase